MKRESRLLFAKAVDSLVLGIEHSNRPWDRGRSDAALKTRAPIRHAKTKDDAECHRRIAIGKASFDRYSRKAIERLREAKKTADMDQVWTDYQRGQRRRGRA
jgi:hypothetical protein